MVEIQHSNREGFQPDLWGFERGEEDFFVHEHLPYSDFSIYVPEDSIYPEAFHNLPLGRLANVKQLSLLSYVGPDPDQTHFLEFNHDRFDHSLTVALIAERILRQNDIPQEQVNTVIIASLLHDIATPAYGDATKQLDMPNLHEEDFWWKTLDNNGKKYIEEKAGSKETVDDIIKNKGIFGKLLDIADRIVYTTKDLKGLQVSFPSPLRNSNPLFLEMNLILLDFQQVGNIFKDVGIDQKKGEIFFNDPKHLEVFLRLRAHLHQHLYLHPVNQAKDLFMAKAILPLYSSHGDSLLTPEKLREMNDYDLLGILAEYYGLNNSGTSFIEDVPHLITDWHANFEKFETLEDAEKRKKELEERKDTVVVGIKESRAFDPATEYKVAVDGQYIPFREHNPRAAREIEEIEKSTRGIFLFWADVSQDTPTNKLLKTVLGKK